MFVPFPSVFVYVCCLPTVHCFPFPITVVTFSVVHSSLVHTLCQCVRVTLACSFYSLLAARCLLRRPALLAVRVPTFAV